MKGIYVIAIAFLAVNADQEQSVQSIPKEDFQQLRVYTVCPFPEPWNGYNITTNLPHEYDCTKFYKCFLGKGILQECPLMIPGDPVTRLHYNRFLQVCDWPWQAGCESCPQTYTNGTYLPYFKINDKYNNCHFRECRNGLEYPGTCPYNTCFSRTCQDCVSYRNGGNCSPWTTYLPPDTTTPPTTDQYCRNGDTRAHECDCGKYYSCYYADWIVYECTGGLHYSPTSKQCLPPDVAKCLIPQ